jgi:hypothetical protein
MNNTNTDTKLNSIFGISSNEAKPMTIVGQNNTPAIVTPYDELIRNLREAIKTASNTMGNSASVANNTEDPKAYQAYSSTAKALSDLIDRLGILIEKREKFVAASDPKEAGPKTVHNTLILTTVDAIAQAKNTNFLSKDQQ